MAAETTYLELSEADGGSHKFYEVVVDDTELTIRYGRIGDAGATTKSTFADNAKARAAAAKKIGEKVRKGYAPRCRARGPSARCRGAPSSAPARPRRPRRCCGDTGRARPRSASSSTARSAWSATRPV
ncbi:WGR domain-containing protein [Catellatospora coxensis]